MGEGVATDVGKIGWTDITVDDAEGLKAFYAAVIGTEIEPTSMGDYDDYSLVIESPGEPSAGVCHRRGENTVMPSGWTVYFIVEDIDRSIEVCLSRGGKLLVEPRGQGSSRFCVIEDPSGAHCALYQPS